MKRGMGRRGLEAPEKLIWMLGQAVAALFVVVVLLGYVDSAMKGGLLAKQFYPGNFGLLASVVAQSPDNMVIGDMVDRFGDTTFTFTGTGNNVEVTATTLKGPSRFWVFTPLGVGFTPFTITNATGAVHAVKEGNQVTLRKGSDFNYGILPCPTVNTAQPNGLALGHIIDVPDDTRVQNNTNAAKSVSDIAARISALLGRGTKIATGSLDQRKAVQGNGLVISLLVDPVIDDRNRIVAYYNPRASADTQGRSAKLGCLIINKLQAAFGDKIDGVAVLPTADDTALPIDRPGVEVVIGQLGAKRQLLSEPASLAKAVYDAVGAYYNG